MRISIFGDSILEGVRLIDGKYTRDSSLQKQLEDDTGVELVNRSRFGATISRGAKSLARSLEHHELGDYTIIEFGGNDCDHNWAQVAASPDREHICATPEDQFEAQYLDMIAKVRAEGSIPVVATLPPISARRYFSWICRRGLDSSSILKWLGDVQVIARRQAQFSTLAESIARKTGCPILDLRSIFPQDEARLEQCLCEDGIHPNQEGQKLMYSNISRFVAGLQPA